MNKIVLHTVRIYIQLGLFFYYKKIIVNGKKSIPKDQPVLFLSNHQNALIDALLLATKSGRLSYFLTRAGVFKKPFVSRLLHSLHMRPIYRVRDGWSTIAKNKSVFSNTVNLLHDNKAVTIFPEGNHNLERRVRPLSKGFTRIILEHRQTYPKQSIHLIPVGLNYQAPKAMGSTVSICFGKALASKSYNHLDDFIATKQIKQDVFNSLISLTTHIPQSNYASIVEKLNKLNVDFTNPNIVNRCIVSQFKTCQVKRVKQSNFKVLIKPILYLLLCVPILVWRHNIKPKIKEAEFLSTFRFAISITLVPLWLFVISAIIWLAFNFVASLIFILGSLILILIYNKA
ncbi:1-acyl-sn-glycerol-3-phosphate acyltransferase [Olleya sp. AS48]|uniref:1-acyl-sn-glycerol-3-phosphate acyltransferase n=1 Tax=Olleya sp. AS48 TaxID=3135774 RepID=UPI00316E5552